MHHQQVTPNYTNEYSLVLAMKSMAFRLGHMAVLHWLNYFYILLTGSMSLKSEGPLPPCFLFICMCSVFSHFWTDLNLSSGKMAVIQVLAGRAASVNSLFSHLGVQFPLLVLRESDELWIFIPPTPRTDPAWAALCLRPGRTSFCSSLSSSQVRLWDSASASDLPVPATWNWALLWF